MNFFSQIDSEQKKNNFKLLFGLDANRSFILKNRTRFLGLRIGVEINDKHKFGFGFYGMESPIVLDRELNKDEFPNTDGKVNFNFNYSGLFYEYVWLQTKRWELSSPLNFGVGDVDLFYNDTLQNKRVSLFNGGASVFITSGAVEYKITRWLALGAGAGYRFVFSRDENLIKGLNAPIYFYRVKILMGEVLRMWFKKDYINKDWDI